MNNTTDIKRIIFELNDNMRILWNTYYLEKDSYTKEDLMAIRGFIIDTKKLLEELKKECENNERIRKK